MLKISLSCCNAIQKLSILIVITVSGFDIHVSLVKLFQDVDGTFNVLDAVPIHDHSMSRHESWKTQR